MASIEDFVGHRWDDAREELRHLDSIFVGKLENDIRLDRLGLTSPPRREVIGTPKQRLPSKWHRLLEACYEMVRQKDILETSAEYITDKGVEEMPPIDFARKRDYHFRSWVIHADTLCESVQYVIGQSTRVYIVDAEERKSISSPLTERVRSEIRNRLKDIRNDYVHPARRSWSEAATEEGYWEGCVALGMTPRKHLDEFYYPMEAESVYSVIYSESLAETKSIFDCLGSILRELESKFSGRTCGLQK